MMNFDFLKNTTLNKVESTAKATSTKNGKAAIDSTLFNVVFFRKSKFILIINYLFNHSGFRAFTIKYITTHTTNKPHVFGLVSECVKMFSLPTLLFFNIRPYKSSTGFVSTTTTFTYSISFYTCYSFCFYPGTILCY